jgi:hypothetical protein
MASVTSMSLRDDLAPGPRFDGPGASFHSTPHQCRTSPLSRRTAVPDVLNAREESAPTMRLVVRLTLMPVISLATSVPF